MSWGSEADLARAVVGYLEDLHWDVYQEVSDGEHRADIVAVQAPLVTVVETKKSLTFDVIAQATRWHGRAHRVFVAVPYAKWSGGRQLAFRVCEERGIGVLLCQQGYAGAASVSEQVAPRLNRRIRDGLAAELRPEHKTFAAAGSASGGHYTAFKGTCRALLRAAQEKPGSTLKELIDSIEHHYATPSSARTHLARWIEDGGIPGLGLEREGRVARVVVA
jgi:hypothetical protein